ncbi:MAG TPA: TIM barrel protein [Chthonomonadales bacterium]|nr:TIM barrel protein [Chthonomonadales bacterium]
MQLGIVTYNVAKDWDLGTLLRVCQACGLTGVEFRTTHAHGVEPILGPADRADVRRRCADAGIVQTSLGTVCEFHAPDPGVVRSNIASCRSFCELARDIGALGVKVRPNGLPPEVEPERTLEQIGKALIECGRIGADLGVEIWVEVHGPGTSAPANVRRIMDHCGHPNVGITWNSNRTDMESGSVRRAFDLLGGHIRCCHITELWSDYPWREMFGLLKRARYDRYMLCELGTSFPPDEGRTFLQCYAGLFRELCR